MISKKTFFIFFGLLFVSRLVYTQPFNRNLFAKFTPQTIVEALLPKNEWKPFPKSTSDWDQVVDDSIQQLLIHEAEQYLHVPFAALPASLMLEYKKNGNRTNYEELSFKKREQLFSLIVAESMEQKGRFLTDIVDGIWSTCEESYWGIPAHLYMQKAGVGMADVQNPSVDIFAGEASTILALADYFLGRQLDSISPLLRERIYYEVDRRILTPMEKESRDYWYMRVGTKAAPVNNWNPWVVSCWMTSLLLLEKDQQRRASELRHALLTLDNYINWLGEDGAIDEGPSYWSGAIGRLFDALNILESASAGKLSIYRQPIIQKAESYIYKVHIAGNYFINTADASPTISQDGLLLYRIGTSVQDELMRSFGVWAYRQFNKKAKGVIAKDFSKPRRILNILVIKECEAQKGSPPQLIDIWLESIQLMAARSINGLFIATHGGHNAESHNHNDIGDFIIYADGQPVIIDAGFGTYTSKTFSKDRYTLWYNNSAYHNLPVINGFTQEAGAQYEAKNVVYTSVKTESKLVLDIAAAYPKEAGIAKWNRAVSLEKSRGKIDITDTYKMEKPLQKLTQTFMTICNGDLSQKGKIIFEIPAHKPLVMEYDPTIWEVKREQMPGDAPDEKRLSENWGHRTIWRYMLINKSLKNSGVLKYSFKTGI